jgi:hypothetical protein
LKQQQQQQRKKMSRNKLVAGSLVIFCGVMASFPFVYKKYYLGNRNITHELAPLSGQTIIRGAYINTGSKDIGAVRFFPFVQFAQLSNYSRDFKYAMQLTPTYK